MNIKDLYNEIAESYESKINSRKVDAKLVKNLLKIFKKYKIKNGSILDLGCGPGNLKTELGNNFKYTGIDIADKMLFLARKRGYKTIPGKIENLLPKIKSKSFDYVIALSSLHFVRNIKKVMENIERISRKGFLVTFDGITDNYIEKIKEKYSGNFYNHTKYPIKDTSEDISFIGWKSPRDSEKIVVRMVFKEFKD